MVGTQIDLRDDGNTVEKLQKNKQKPITFDQGEKLSRELRAVKYVECSALTQVNIIRATSQITSFKRLKWLQTKMHTISNTIFQHSF